MKSKAKRAAVGVSKQPEKDFKVISKNRLPRWMTERINLNESIWYKPLFDHYTALDHFEIRRIKSRIAHKEYTEGKPDTEETIYISQPYGPLDMDALKTMIEIAEKYGIEFDIRGDSDHVPGRTVMIEWRKKQE